MNNPDQIREHMLAVVRMKRDLETALGELATARARLLDNDPAGALRRLNAFFNTARAGTEGSEQPQKSDPGEPVTACGTCGLEPAGTTPKEPT